MQLVSEKGSSSTGVPIPANAKPFAKRTWVQRRQPGHGNKETKSQPSQS